MASNNVGVRSDEHLQWLTYVNDRLGPEGFSLLKVLYLRDLRRRNLDDLEGPRELVQVSEELSWEQSLALFVHRLRVLVPPPTTVDDRLRDTKELGAQRCLEDLEKRAINIPQMRVELSNESKMLECLVKSYVNLTQQERSTLKRGLLQESVHESNATIFEAFARLFTKEKSHNRCQNIVATFVASMDLAKCPKQIYIELQENLNTHGLHDVPIPIPGIL